MNTPMRTATRRFRLPLAALALFLAALSACSYDPLAFNLTLSVNGIPAGADHLDVVVTDSAATTYERHPAFGTGAYEGRALDLALQLDNPGAVTVHVTARNHDQTLLAEKVETGTFDGTNTLVLATTLVPIP